MGAQIGCEPLNRYRLVAFGDVDHLACLGVGEQAHVVVTFGARGFIDRNAPHLAEVRRADSCIHVAFAQRHDSVNRQPRDTRHTRESHLPAQQHYKRLKQQREAGQLSGPGRRDLTHRAVGTFHPGHSDLELALVLEEIQMPIGLGHRVMDRMLPRLSRDREMTAYLEIYADPQLLMVRLEVNPSDVPGCADVQCRFKNLLSNHVQLRISTCSERYHSSSTGKTLAPPVRLSRFLLPSADRPAALPMKREARHGSRCSRVLQDPDRPLRFQ